MHDYHVLYLDGGDVFAIEFWISEKGYCYEWVHYVSGPSSKIRRISGQAFQGLLDWYYNA